MQDHGIFAAFDDIFGNCQKVARAPCEYLPFLLREGLVLGALALQVNRLIRVSYGPFQLGELPAGGVEEVATRTLRDQLGERLSALAGADFSAPGQSFHGSQRSESPPHPAAPRPTPDQVRGRLSPRKRGEVKSR